jgi:NAD(P)-dependent dehydrogenase (short-subunit alcohol dehydrogenase family)
MPFPESAAALMDLGGRAAIVTGGGSGIGRAICLRLAGAGASVVVADVDPDGAAMTVKLIEEAGGSGRAVSTVADVRSPRDAAAVAQFCVDSYGRLDILVNNAGLYPHSPVLETDEEFWDRVQDINVKGTFLFSQACARVMAAAGTGGNIVNLASRQAYRPGAGLAHYGASKAAVVSLTQSLALELGRSGIRVNAVAPGPIPHENVDRGSEEQQNAYLARLPLGRFGTPDDIARAVQFIVSDAASYMTGATLVIDGGSLLP